MNISRGHGGTGFGVTAGANYEPPAATYGGRYQPTVTSYDYDAPLDERGAPTAKFHAYRRPGARHPGRPAAEAATATGAARGVAPWRGSYPATRTTCVPGGRTTSLPSTRGAAPHSAVVSVIASNAERGSRTGSTSARATWTRTVSSGCSRR